MKRGAAGSDGGNDGGNGGNDERKRRRVDPETPELETNPFLIVLLAVWMGSFLPGPNWNFEEVCRTWLEIMRLFRS